MNLKLLYHRKDRARDKPLRKEIRERKRQQELPHDPES